MKIFSEDVVKVGNLLYLFGTDINMLYSINLENDEVTFIGKIPEENILKRRLVSKMMYWDNKLYLLPLSSNNIWIYSVLDKTWTKIEIEEYENNWANSYFRNAIIYKHHMFIFGGYYPAILILDLEIHKIKYIREPFLEKRNISCIDLFFRGKPLKQGNLVYLASSIDNTVLVFNLENYTYSWNEVGDKSNRYAGIVWDGYNFWLASRSEPMVIKWDGKDKVIEYKDKKNADFSKGKFIGIVGIKEGFIVLFRGKKGNSLFITKDGKISKDRSSHIFYKRIKDEYIFQCVDGRIHYINNAGVEKIYEGNFNDVRQFVLETDKRDRKFETTFRESEPFTLKEWMSMFV